MQCLPGVRNGLVGGALALAWANILAAQEVPIVQPGPPGQASRALTADEASRIADTRYSPDDVAFMRGMIHHHRQAIELVAVVKDRTNTPDLIAAADRIAASQQDEIAFMEQWLTARGEAVAEPANAAQAAHAEHMTGSGPATVHAAAAGPMKGLATAEQMAQLAAASGAVFDRRFLLLMVAHHEGAVEMVTDLLARPGSAHDPALFEFTGDLRNEQQAEINRMGAMLAGLSPDPRAQLAAGLTDPGVAAWNMALVASLPKPAGFFDPANPGGLAPPLPADEPAEEQKEQAAERGEKDGEQGTQFGERSSLLSFWNTDIAFSGDLMVTGNYHGFNIYRLGDGGLPSLVSSVVCPGGQGDVSIVGTLLVMSVEQTRGRVDCGLQGVQTDASPERFRGLRIFDISRPPAAGAGGPGADLPRQPHALGCVGRRSADRRLQLRHGRRA